MSSYQPKSSNNRFKCVVKYDPNNGNMSLVLPPQPKCFDDPVLPPRNVLPPQPKVDKKNLFGPIITVVTTGDGTTAFFYEG